MIKKINSYWEYLYKMMRLDDPENKIKYINKAYGVAEVALRIFKGKKRDKIFYEWNKWVELFIEEVRKGKC